MKQFATKLRAIGLAATLAVGGATGVAAELQQITIGTNPSGTMNYALGSGLAKLFQTELGIRSVAQPFGGSSIYLPMLQTGDVTIGVNNGLDSGMAYTGTPPYQQAYDKITTLGRLMRLEYSFFVRADSGIETMADLKGKRVVVKIPAVATLEAVNRRQLETAGLTVDDVEAVEAAGLRQGVEAVVEGRADATGIGLGISALRKADASIPGGVRIIPLGEKGDAAFMDEGVPGAGVTTSQPGPGNVGVTEAIPVTAIEIFVNAGGTVSEEDAYSLTKSIYENWEQLQEEIPAMKGFDRDDMALPLTRVPFHPGAERFFREIGIWDNGRS